MKRKYNIYILIMTLGLFQLVSCEFRDSLDEGNDLLLTFQETKEDTIWRVFNQLETVLKSMDMLQDMGKDSSGLLVSRADGRSQLLIDSIQWLISALCSVEVQLNSQRLANIGRKLIKIGYLDEALNLLKKVRVPNSFSSTKVEKKYLAIIYMELSYLYRIVDQDYDLSLYYSKNAYNILKDIDQSDSLSTLSLVCLAQTLRMKKDYFESMVFAYQALQNANNFDDRYLQGLSLYAIILCHISNNQIKQAWIIFDTNKDLILNHDGISVNDKAVLLANVASLLGLISRAHDAENYFQEAIRHCQSEECYQEDYIWYRYAYFKIGLNNHRDVSKYIDNGIQAAIKRRDDPWIMLGRMYNLLGRSLAMESNYDDAIFCFKQAIVEDQLIDGKLFKLPHVSNISINENILYYLNNLSRAYKQKYDISGDESAVDSAFGLYVLMDTIINSHLSNVSELSILHFADTYVSYYSDMLHLMCRFPRLCQKDLMFDIISRAKNQIFLSNKYKTIAVNDNMQKLFDIQQNQILFESNDFLDFNKSLNINYEKIIYYINNNLLSDSVHISEVSISKKAYNPLTQVLSIDTLRRRSCSLNKGFLNILKGSKNYYFSLLICDSIYVFEKSIDDVERVSKLFRSVLTNSNSKPSDFAKHSLDMFTLVFSEISIETLSHLIIFPDGIFTLIPFETFIFNPEMNQKFEDFIFLGDVVNISYGLHPTELNTKRNRLFHFNSAYFIGFSDDWTALNSKSKIYTEISSTYSIMETFKTIFPNVDVVHDIGRQACRYRVQEEKWKSEIFHIQTHTVFDELSRFGYGYILRKCDNAFQFDTLFPYRENMTFMDSKLAVLSSCSTNSGFYINGDGYQSHARAVLQAGSERAVVSLWAISDLTSNYINKLFYSNLSQHSFSIALKLSREQYREQVPDFLTHPYYWSGVVAYH